MAHRAKKKDVFRITVKWIMVDMVNYKKVLNFVVSAAITFTLSLKSNFPLRVSRFRKSVGIDNFGFSGGLKSAFFGASRLAASQGFFDRSFVGHAANGTDSFLSRAFEFSGLIKSGRTRFAAKHLGSFRMSLPRDKQKLFAARLAGFCDVGFSSSFGGF